VSANVFRTIFNFISCLIVTENDGDIAIYLALLCNTLLWFFSILWQRLHFARWCFFDPWCV